MYSRNLMLAPRSTALYPANTSSLMWKDLWSAHHTPTGNDNHMRQGHSMLRTHPRVRWRISQLLGATFAKVRKQIQLVPAPSPNQECVYPR